MAEQRKELTADTLATLLLYARDAGNWDGHPWVSGGNVECTKEMRGICRILCNAG